MELTHGEQLALEVNSRRRACELRAIQVFLRENLTDPDVKMYVWANDFPVPTQVACRVDPTGVLAEYRRRETVFYEKKVIAPKLSVPLPKPGRRRAETKGTKP